MLSYNLLMLAYTPLRHVPVIPTRVMGIDPSLTSTGIALIWNGGVGVERLVAPASCGHGVRRLVWYSKAISEVLIRLRPDVIGIEDYAYGAANKAHALGELGGMLRMAILQSGLPGYVVSPGGLKGFATGKGNAEKSTVSKELFRRFGVDLNQNDLVDAAGVALATMATHCGFGDHLLTVPQKLAVSKITRFTDPVAIPVQATRKRMQRVAKSVDKPSSRA